MEVGGVTADHFVSGCGERRGDLIDFDVCVRREANEFSSVQHASRASTEFDGQFLVLRICETSHSEGSGLDEPRVALASFENGLEEMNGISFLEDVLFTVREEEKCCALGVE